MRILLLLVFSSVLSVANGQNNLNNGKLEIINTEVQRESSISSISVYPDPIDTKTVNLQLGNQPAGIYNLRILNPVGQVLLATKIIHAGGNYIENLNRDHSLPRGLYLLEISNKQTGTQIIKLKY